MAPTAFSTCTRRSPACSRACVAKARAGERSWAAGGAALATVALLSGTPPAVAGITFTEKPTVKSYKDNAPKVQAEAPSLPNPADKLKGGFNLELPKPPSIPTLGGGDKAEKKGSDTVGGESFKFDTQSLWPLGIVAVGGTLFALPKIDKGFEQMYETAWVKDSGAKGFGIGTENVLKDKQQGGQQAYMAAYYPDETSAAGGNRKYTGQQKDPKKIGGTRMNLPKLGKNKGKK